MGAFLEVGQKIRERVVLVPYCIRPLLICTNGSSPIQSALFLSPGMYLMGLTVDIACNFVPSWLFSLE